MPKSVFQKPDIGEAKPTTVMLQQADHSFVQPEGKIKDILVRIDKFIFPTDFLILDCKADENAPIILGRPFLATSKAVIDFDKDEIAFQVDNDQVKMQVFSTPAQLEWAKTPYQYEVGTCLPTPPPSTAFSTCPTTAAQAAEWNVKGKNSKTISRPHLQPEAKLWNTFVKRNLMPTSHNQTVDRTRLVPINAILTGFKFNVGEVIAQEISATCKNDKGILVFPCLIYALCRRAAVRTSPRDKYAAEKSG
ncbi:hypothetical protein V6N13_034261 [Hibiscus sabdariffa]